MSRQTLLAVLFVAISTSSFLCHAQVTSLNGLTGAVGATGSTGITVTTSSPNIVIQNTGVTGVTGSTGIGVSGATGAVTITNTEPFTTTSTAYVQTAPSATQTVNQPANTQFGVVNNTSGSSSPYSTMLWTDPNYALPGTGTSPGVYLYGGPTSANYAVTPGLYLYDALNVNWNCYNPGSDLSGLWEQCRVLDLNMIAGQRGFGHMQGIVETKTGIGDGSQFQRYMNAFGGSVTYNDESITGETVHVSQLGWLSGNCSTGCTTGSTLVSVGASPSCTGDCPASLFADGGFLLDTASRLSPPTATITPYSITEWSITSNVATFISANSLSAGDYVSLTGFDASGSFFNGVTAQVLSTGLSGSQFEINFTYVNEPVTTETAATTIGYGTENGVLFYNLSGIAMTPSTAIGFVNSSSCTPTTATGNPANVISMTCNITLTSGSFTTGSMYLNGGFDSQVQVTSFGTPSGGVQSVTFNTFYPWNLSGAAAMQGSSVDGLAFIQTGTLLTQPVAYMAIGATSSSQLIYGNCAFGYCTGAASGSNILKSGGITFYPVAEITGTNNGAPGAAQLAYNTIPFSSGDSLVGAPAAEVQMSGLNIYMSQATPVDLSAHSRILQLVDGGPYPMENDIEITPYNYTQNVFTTLGTGIFGNAINLSTPPITALLNIAGGGTGSSSYDIFNDNGSASGHFNFSRASGTYSFGGNVYIHSTLGVAGEVQAYSLNIGSASQFQVDTSGDATAASLTVNGNVSASGVTTLTNGADNTALYVGSGATTDFGSDAYVEATAATGLGAAFTLIRADTTGYDSIDLLTASSGFPGWSIQMGTGAADLTIFDRAPFVTALDCQSGATNPCTFGKPIVATNGAFSGGVTATALAVTGVTTLTNGADNTALYVGSGTATDFGSDAYVEATATTGLGAAFTLIRADTTGYDSIDLLTASSGFPGWSIQMGTGATDLTIFDRAPYVIALDCQSGASNPCTFGKPVIAPSYQETLYTPASSSATCTTGQFTDDSNYHYVCVATNTWKRVALSSF